MPSAMWGYFLVIARFEILSPGLGQDSAGTSEPRPCLPKATVPQLAPCCLNELIGTQLPESTCIVLSSEWHCRTCLWEGEATARWGLPKAVPLSSLPPGH